MLQWLDRIREKRLIASCLRLEGALTDRAEDGVLVHLDPEDRRDFNAALSAREKRLGAVRIRMRERRIASGALKIAPRG